MSVYTFQGLMSIRERWMIFGCLVHTKIWGIFHTHNLDSTRQLKGYALNLFQVHLLRNSVQLTIATLLSTMCWESSTSQSSRCEGKPMFPLFSNPLPICVFFTLGICVLFLACLFLNLFFIEVHWFTTLYFYFCIRYNMLTTKKLVSMFHHTVDLLYPLFPPCPPLPLW